MFQSIRGKRVLVTGAGVGIGAAIAEFFAQHGGVVGVHYRQHREAAETLVERIRRTGGQAHLFAGDLQDPAVRRTLVDDFVREYGAIDVLVNNAGACYGYRHFSELDEDSWDRTMSLNAKAPFFLSRQAFKHMRENGGGRILNISSVAMKYGGPRSLHYAASKSALDALTIGFAKEGAKYNILVNSIRCGVIDTAMHTQIEGYSAELFRKRIEMIALKRAGTPLDVARMALFLASECGDFITGEVFTVAGGD